jgi:hypothetical protein
MGKKRSRPVVLPKKQDNIIHIDLHEVERKIRKSAVRPVQYHRRKTSYSRKPKHPKKEDE